MQPTRPAVAVRARYDRSAPVGLLHRATSLARLCAAVCWFGICVSGVILAALVGATPVAAWFMRTWCRWTLPLIGAQPSWSGTEHVPPHGGFVLAANHESDIDGVMLVGWVPRYLHVVAKKELFKTPGVGAGFRALRFIELDRHHHGRARQGVDKGTQLVADGAAALIFPEGTRSRDGSLRPFKKGAVVMALQAGVPLLPVGIAGTWEGYPPGTLQLNPGPVRFVVGEPIPVDGLTLEDRDDLNARLYQAIATLRAQARAELGLPDDPPGDAA